MDVKVAGLFGAALTIAVLVFPVPGAASSNKQPTIRAGLFVTEFETQANVCDDSAGFMLVRITVTRKDESGTSRRAITRRIDAPSSNEGQWACDRLSFHNPSPRWFYVGKFTYVFRVRDAHGLWSKPYVMKFNRVGDD